MNETETEIIVPTPTLYDDEITYDYNDTIPCFYDNINSSYVNSSYGNISYDTSLCRNETIIPLYGQLLFIFKDHYTFIHGYLAIGVCIFGTIANILNIIVLTRKNMVSATNSILTGLALADMVVMIDYVPFALHTYVISSNEKTIQFTYTWAVLTLVHAHISVTVTHATYLYQGSCHDDDDDNNSFLSEFHYYNYTTTTRTFVILIMCVSSVTAHAISSYLTVALAIWRYLSVKYPTQSRGWLTMRSSYLTIIGTYLAVPISCIPVYLSFMIVESKDYITNEPFYMIDFSTIATTDTNMLLKTINFWVFSVIYKLVPCVLLTFLSRALINLLHEAEERRLRLKSSSIPMKVTSSCQQNESTQVKEGISSKRAQGNDVGISIIKLPSSSASSDKCNNRSETKRGGGGISSNDASNLASLPKDDEKEEEVINDMSTSIKEEEESKCKKKKKMICIDGKRIHEAKDDKVSRIDATANDENNQSKDQGAKDEQEFIKRGGPSVHFKVKDKPCPPPPSRTTSVDGQQGSNNGNKTTRTTTAPTNSSSSSSSQSDRTTHMLLAVLFLFLITESPTGLIALCCGIFGENWFMYVYSPLGELFDMLALINSAINFILYCTMSTAFRNTFASTFFPRNGNHYGTSHADHTSTHLTRA